MLSNLPFYTVLFPLFLDLLRTRVSSRGDAALSDLVKATFLLCRLSYMRNNKAFCIFAMKYRIREFELTSQGPHYFLLIDLHKLLWIAELNAL